MYVRVSDYLLLIINTVLVSLWYMASTVVSAMQILALLAPQTVLSIQHSKLQNPWHEFQELK